MGRDRYVIAEKILEYGEPLASDWDLEGTSGYEFLAYTNRVLTDQEGAAQLKTFYENFTGEHKSYEDIVFEKKKTPREKLKDIVRPFIKPLYTRAKRLFYK